MPKLVQSPASLLKTMLTKYQLSGNQLAKSLGINSATINFILNEKTKISVPVALRLAKFFNTVPEYWLAMQMKYDLSIAAKDKALAKAVSGISKVSKPVKPRGKPAKAKAAPAKKTAAVKGKKPAAEKKGKKPAAEKAKKN